MRRPLPLVALAGAAGTGKTTLGTSLADLLGGSLVDLDTLTYLHEERTERYERLTAAALEMLIRGVPVVAAAPWTRELQDPRWYANLDQRAARLGGHLLVVWLHCAPDVLRARLARRDFVRDAGKLARWQAWSAALGRAPRVPHVAIDTTALTSAPHV